MSTSAGPHRRLDRSLSRRLAAVLGALALVGETVLLATGLQAGNVPNDPALLLLERSLPLWVLAVAVVWWVRPTRRVAAFVVLGAGAVLQIVAVVHRPSSSDDAYRYVWDAKVQFSGTDPYRYPPSAPQLARLRDRALFGRPDHCQHAFPGGCTSINRPTVHTVYPPFGQLAFDIADGVSFGSRGGVLALQIFGALGSLLIAWLLLRRGPPWLAAMWAWCPVVAIEYGNNAHIDWLAVLLVVVALSVRRNWLAGVLVGAAIGVKIYPALVLPSLLRRSWTAVAAAISLLVLSYVPHVFAVGTKVIGYLPGYLHEQEYGSGGRLQLLGAVLPHPVDTIVGAMIVAAAAVWAWRRGPRDDPARSAVIVVGVTFLVFTPGFGWYGGILLALAAFTGALEWVPVALASAFAYQVADHATLVYGVGALAGLLILAARHRLAASGQLGREWAVRSDHS